MKTEKNVLVIGAGWIGRRHLAAFQRNGGTNVAICEPDAGRRKEAAREFSVGRTFASLEDALAVSWDGAIVATPAHTHVPIGTTVAGLGVATLVEKPVSVSCDGVAAWQAAAGARHVPVMVGFVYRCHPLLVAMRDELRRGRIGEPLQLVAQRGAHLPARRPDYQENYYARPEQGGGVVHDILSHLYNAAEWLIGPIERLAADAAHLALPGVEVDDTVHVIARHGSVLASYTVNQHQPAAEFTLTINGTRGSLRACFHEHRWDFAREPDRGWTSTRMPPLSAIDWFARQADAFASVMEHRGPPPCSLAEGVVTLDATLATLQAAAQRRGWVDLIPHASRVIQPV